MNDEEANKSMIANLFLQGKPLVLNYQLMESRLKRPRLTPSQRAEYKRQLLAESGFLTIADSESDEPLLIHFLSENDRFTLRVATPGKFYGCFLSMEKMRDAHGDELEAGHLVVLEQGNPTRFCLQVVSPGINQLFNVAPKAITDDEAINESVAFAIVKAVHDQIKGPTYFYANKGNLELDPQQYFSDSFHRAAHVIWDAKPVNLTVQVKGRGVLDLDDIG